MATLKYWLWLTTRKGISSTGAFGLLDHFGTPEAAYFADPAEYDLIPGLPRQGKESLLDKSLTGAEKILEDCEKLGIRLLTVSDTGYPERLRNIFDPPAVLYMKGKELTVDDQVVVGVIGTRHPTPYGIAQAQRFGFDLARQGAVVASGLARGLDSEAARAALRGGGTVAAVLGCGLDVIYPPENRYLYEDVIASGVLISEYPPGTRPYGSNFPVRNRIISGISLGVVVVEGGMGSGTAITAAKALEQDRDIFAIPGPVDAPMSYTPNRLIRENAAVLVSSASDILEEYKAIYPSKISLKPGLPSETTEPARGPAPEEKRSAEKEEKTAEREKEVDKPPEIPYIHWKKLTPALTDDQRDILLALRDRDLVQDEIIELTQIPARRAFSAITMLQISGLVNELPGKRFSAAVRIQTD